MTEEEKMQNQEWDDEYVVAFRNIPYFLLLFCDYSTIYFLISRRKASILQAFA